MKLSYACKSCGKLIAKSGRCEKCNINRRSRLITFMIITLILIIYSTGFGLALFSHLPLWGSYLSGIVIFIIIFFMLGAPIIFFQGGV